MKKRLLFMAIFLFLMIPHTNYVNAQSKSLNLLTEMKVKNGFMLTKSNAIFKNINTSGSAGNYTIQGEARPHNGTFYYVVEDGHYVFISETEVNTNTKFPSWSDFTIKVDVPKKRLLDNGTLIIYLFEKGNHNQEMQYVFPIVLEQFWK